MTGATALKVINNPTKTYGYVWKPKPWNPDKERPEWLKKLTLTKEVKNSPEINQLLRMFQYQRPAGSSVEEEFIKTFIDTLEDMNIDDYGNRYCYVDHEDGTPSKVMWTSHTDTVHNKEGKQKITFKNDTVRLKDMNKSNCLGADDTAGVWLMLQMIKRGIPGMYVFFREEEIGGKGSTYFSEYNQKLIDDCVDVCISFDRKGYNSVITRQAGGICATREFVDSLNDMLTLPFAGDPGGSFTDSASFTHLIHECTNLSVGYHNAHRANEAQDVRYLYYLMCSICTEFDEDKLFIKRNCLNDSYWNPTPKPTYTRPTTWNQNSTHWNKPVTQTPTQNYGQTYKDMVKHNPEIAVKLLLEHGIKAIDFEEEVYNETGFMPEWWFYGNY